MAFSDIYNSLVNARIRHLLIDAANSVMSQGVTTLDGKGASTADREPLAQPLVSDIYGVQMAQNATVGLSPLFVYDGTDTALWTASEPVGASFTDGSTDQAHDGTKSGLWNGPSVGGTIQFAKGSAQDLTPYDSLTMWVWVASGYGLGDSIEVYGWDGTEVGSRVKLENYFSSTEFGMWHQAVIPLADMGLTAGSIDAIRLQFVTKVGAAPVAYFDGMRLEEPGGALEFRAVAPPGHTWHVTKLRVIMGDAMPLTSSGGPVTGLSPLLLGVRPALTNGVLFNQFRAGVPTNIAAQFTRNGDLPFFDFGTPQGIGDGTDATLHWDLHFDHAVKVNGDDAGDYLRAIINDNVSAFRELYLLAVGGFSPN